MRQRVLISIATFLVATMIGCGGSDTVTVTGKITYNGKPVTNAVVNFLSSDGVRVGSEIAADGGYTISAAPGDYRVVVIASYATPSGWKEGDPPPEIPQTFPQKYSQPGTSELEAKLDAGESQMIIDFELD